MKTKTGSKSKDSVQHRIIAGRRVVIVDATEYQRLQEKADEWEPSLPPPNQRGNYPLEALDIVLALDIVRARRRLGLTQEELARRAGIPAETLCRIEKGRRKPNVATVEKIDKALRQAEGAKRANGKPPRHTKN